jgi:FkbM family methyltransferase
MGLNTWLRSNPALYDAVQRVRDWRLHGQSLRAGSFSQHGEDKVLLELLTSANAKGPFVDIGCNHPFKYSNSYLLHLRGWSGICIDPLRRLSALYARWRQNDRFVCSAVGETEGQIPFYEFEWDMLSTLDAKLASTYRQAGHKLLRESVVRVQRIDALLSEAGVQPPISLLSLDVEGYELTALRTMDLDRWQPQFVCLEVQTADGSSDAAATDYLRARGYGVVRDLGLNLILQRGASETGPKAA